MEGKTTAMAIGIMVICKNCGKDVTPTKSFSIKIFILCAILFGIPGLLYLIYYWVKTPDECPSCHKKVY